MGWAGASHSADLKMTTDEFTDDQRLTVTIQSERLTETNAREGAALIFQCRGGVADSPLLVSLMVPSGVSGIEPRREMIADVASRLAASDVDVKSGESDESYYQLALKVYALREGTGDTALVVPVKLRFDDRPMRTLTWWWTERRAVKGAISLVGGGSDVVVDAVNADRAIAKIHQSPTFRFDLLEARAAISEFIVRCGAIWEATEGGEPAN